MIKAQCHMCRELFEVPNNRALTYVMMNLIPCRACHINSKLGVIKSGIHQENK